MNLEISDQISIQQCSQNVNSLVRLSILIKFLLGFLRRFPHTDIRSSLYLPVFFTPHFIPINQYFSFLKYLIGGVSDKIYFDIITRRNSVIHRNSFRERQKSSWSQEPILGYTFFLWGCVCNLLLFRKTTFAPLSNFSIVIILIYKVMLDRTSNPVVKSLNDQEPLYKVKGPNRI